MPRPTAFTAVDPMFEYSGFEEGLEVWRVENLELEEWPVESFGEFFMGDCYVVLATRSQDNGGLTWDVHYWQGKHSRCAERAVAAIKCTELVRHLESKAAQVFQTFPSVVTSCAFTIFLV